MTALGSELQTLLDTCAPVMQEEEALSQAPEWRGAELVDIGPPW